MSSQKKRTTSSHGIAATRPRETVASKLEIELLRKQLTEFVQQKPDTAARILSGWVHRSAKRAARDKKAA